MDRLIIAAVIVLVAVVVAFVARRRRPDPPTQQSYNVPRQVDRADFDRPSTPWLIVVFTSATCEKCADVVSKANVLQSREVAVVEAEFTAARAIHERYRIDGVPSVVICDAAGITRAGFLGPVTATDLWAAVAEVREPGSSPEPELGRDL